MIPTSTPNKYTWSYRRYGRLNRPKLATNKKALLMHALMSQRKDECWVSRNFLNSRGLTCFLALISHADSVVSPSTGQRKDAVYNLHKLCIWIIPRSITPVFATVCFLEMRGASSPITSLNSSSRSEKGRRKRVHNVPVPPLTYAVKEAEAVRVSVRPMRAPVEAETNSSTKG